MSTPVTLRPAPRAGGLALPVHPGRARAARRLEAMLEAGERAFAVVAILVLSGALLRMGADPDAAAEGGGGAVRQAALLAVYAGTLAVVALRLRAVARAAFRHPPVTLITLLAVASAAWSVAPGITLRRGAALAATTLFGLWLAARFERRELVGLVATAFAVAAVLSLLAGVALPELGRDAAFEGAWRGVFGHKNALGGTMALSAFTFLVLAHGAAPGRRARLRALALLAVALVVLSRSATALVALAGMLAILPVLRAVRARNVPLLLAALAVACAAAVVVGATGAGPGSVLDALGRDATLTGRTALWDAVLATIRDRGGLGYGYAAFWDAESPAAETLFAAIGWRAWHAHNAVLDIWLGLGIVGVVLVAGTVLWAVVRVLRELRAGASPVSVWPMAFLVFVVVSNVTESSILNPDSLHWALFVALVCGAPAAAGLAKAAADGEPDAASVDPADALGPVSPGVRLRARQAAARPPARR